ncbi:MULTISPECIES: hypothetical protein [Methylobacterium]|uniref:hypothetical protein n=1 Tax=Methylobacterium TaxID=407 RepID=UPI0016508F4B|nr:MULTISPECIES: hypothetical protein [Methylobacterium]
MTRIWAENDSERHAGIDIRNMDNAAEIGKPNTVTDRGGDQIRLAVPALGLDPGAP